MTERVRSAGLARPVCNTALLCLVFLCIAIASPVAMGAEQGTVVTARATLKPVQVFDLREETQRMALRGIMGAGVNRNKLAGKNLAGLVAKAPMSAHPTREAKWFNDPFGYKQVQFSEPVPYEFDFGNGVVRKLPLVRVRNSADRRWKDGLLLNLAYTGEITLDGKKFIVEVVQGAGPGFADRLEYPGRFDDPTVSVLLYDKATGERLKSLGRLKQIGGPWYSFESNPSGEQLTVRRIDAVGKMVIDAGTFGRDDFAFLSGGFAAPDGWRLDVGELSFRDGKATVPAATYTFSQIRVRNNGKSYTLLWPASAKPGHGTFTVRPGREAVFAIGKRARLDVRDTSGLDVHGLFQPERLSFELIDTDLGARVIPGKGETYGVTSYRNSRGNELPKRWSGKLCGWTGEYLLTGANRIGRRGALIVAPDPKPAAVVDTRTLTVTADLAGLYGKVSRNLNIKVRNEVRRLHGRFYDFAAPQATFPDFAGLRPDLVRAEAHMSEAATEKAWPGLPQSMSDTFGAVYTCKIWPSTMGKGRSHFTFAITCQGAARLYVDDRLVLEHVSHGTRTTKKAARPLVIEAGKYRDIRIEYVHNTGPAALTVSAKYKTEPYYYGVCQLDPDKDGFAGINPVWIAK
jgi:hypothetical protein